MHLASSLFLLLACAAMSCKGVAIEDTAGMELPVAISRSAQVEEVHNVIMYNTLEYVYFTIPDLIDPPSVSLAPPCPNYGNDYSCQLSTGLQKGLQDVNDLLTVVNRVLTTKGLKSKDALTGSDLRFQDKWVSIPKGVNEKSNRPTGEMISEVGPTWFSEVETQLTLRKLLQTPMPAAEELNSRVVRWVQPLMKAVTVVGPENIQSIFNHLFVGDSSILNFLTSKKALSKQEYKLLADLPRQVSEMQTETRRLLFDVLNSTDTVKTVTEKLEKNFKGHDMKLAIVEDTFIREQVTLADIIRSLYTSIAYSASFASFEECRSSHLPSAVVPPELLKHRLREIENTLPTSVQLAIPASEYQRYYKLPFAECIFDSDGGLLRLAVPVVEKSSSFRLYSFKALQFAHAGNTCAIKAEAKYIIKDVGGNRVFSIDELNEANCRPETGLCQIPMMSQDDSSNFCMHALLTGQAASVIKQTCQLTCTPDSRPSIAQISDDTLIGLHLPKEGVRMECPNGQVALKTDVPNGSIRFKGGCDCKVYIRDQLVGSTRPKICDASQLPKLDVLLPIQMTSFSDLLTFSDDGYDKSSFASVKEIFNPSFNAAPSSMMEALEWTIGGSSVILNILQTLFLLYMKARLGSTSASLSVLAGRLDRIAAFSQYPCTLPTDAYLMLISILALLILAIVPALAKKVYKKISNYHRDIVEDEANRIALANNNAFNQI